MAYSRSGIGGVILIIIVAGARMYRLLDERGTFDPKPEVPEHVENMLDPNYTQNQQRDHQTQMDQIFREQAERDRAFRAQQDAQTDAIFQQSQQRMQEQLERDRQR